VSSDQRLPVTIVTGFLGAGKTTLIFRLVIARHRERIGVIVSDVVDTAIDGELLSGVVEAVDSVAASTGGCAHLVRALHRMHRIVPDLDRIVVETSGLDDPEPLLNAINRDVECARVDAVIALADAAEPVDEQYSLARRQLQLATHIIVSKADLVSTAELSRVRARVRALNPAAEIHAGGGHILDCELLLDRLAHTDAHRDALSCANAPLRRRATRALADHAQRPARRRSSKF
jgi:G3E family GTPase